MRNSVPSVLDRIIASTRKRVSLLKRSPLQAPPKSFRSLPASILSRKKEGRRAIISEIKFASPSKGPISEPSDVNQLAGRMFSAGACGISVLTEPQFFSGSLDYLRRIVVPLPLLRKDFIIDEAQIVESRIYGADSVLLIARILGDKLKKFVVSSRRLNMEPLVEVHTEEEVALAVDAGAMMIGINNRDLDTLEIDLKTTKKLSKLVPKGKLIVSESGIGSLDDVKSLEKHADAFLIGTSIMQSGNVASAVKEFVDNG